MTKLTSFFKKNFASLYAATYYFILSEGNLCIYKKLNSIKTN